MYNHVSSFQDTFFYDIRKEERKIKEWIALLHNFKHFSGISCCWFALPQEPEEAAPCKSCFWFLLDCRSSWETRKVPLGSSLSFRPWLGLAAFTILWLNEADPGWRVSIKACKSGGRKRRSQAKLCLSGEHLQCATSSN